jgi:hypothetical protein
MFELFFIFCRMRPHFVHGLLFLFLCCKDRKADTTVQKRPDSAGIAATSTRASISAPDTLAGSYITQVTLELPVYSVCAASKYDFEGQTVLKEDSSFYFKGNYLIVMDKRTKKADTVEISAESSSGGFAQILDVTGSLRMRRLMLEVVWPGNSDWYTSTFVGYKGDTLKELFTLENPGGEPVILERKDSGTLAGTISGRDELVYAFESCPITVSLSNFTVDQSLPEKQYIGYETVSTGDIKGWREHSSYTIKAGTKLRVDTLYRSLKMVDLRVADSVVVRVKLEEAKEKIEKNNAG